MVNFLYSKENLITAYNTGDLSKGLSFEVFGRLLFTFDDVDFDELERNPLFVQDRGDAMRACRMDVSI